MSPESAECSAFCDSLALSSGLVWTTRIWHSEIHNMVARWRAEPVELADGLSQQVYALVLLFRQAFLLASTTQQQPSLEQLLTFVGGQAQGGRCRRGQEGRAGRAEAPAAAGGRGGAGAARLRAHNQPQARQPARGAPGQQPGRRQRHGQDARRWPVQPQVWPRPSIPRVVSHSRDTPCQPHLCTKACFACCTTLPSFAYIAGNAHMDHLPSFDYSRDV